MPSKTSQMLHACQLLWPPTSQLRIAAALRLTQPSLTPRLELSALMRVRA